MTRAEIREMATQELELAQRTQTVRLLNWILRQPECSDCAARRRAKTRSQAKWRANAKSPQNRRSGVRSSP